MIFDMKALRIYDGNGDFIEVYRYSEDYITFEVQCSATCTDTKYEISNDDAEALFEFLRDIV